MEQVSLFSNGPDGALIVVVTIAILVGTIRERIAGLQLHNLSSKVLFILWPGGRLVWQPAVGLLNDSNPEAGRKVREQLDELLPSEKEKQARVIKYLKILEGHADVDRCQHSTGEPEKRI